MTEQRGTILVTGSSGFLGYDVARALSGSFDVVGFDRRAPSHPPPTAECLYVDLTTEASLARGLDAVREGHGERLASVCHFAAYYDFSGAPSPLYERVTIEGTRRLLRMLRERFTVEQFIFSSTMLVHAPTEPGRPINEDSPLQPKWAYPESKLRTEQVILHERGDVPVVLLRIAGVYNELGHSATLPYQIQRTYERTLEAYVFPGDLTHGQAMVHLDDVVDLYERLPGRRTELPAELTLLVGEPQTMGYGDLQTMIAKELHGEAWTTRPIPKWLARLGATLQERLPLNGKPYIKPWMIDLADDHFELDIARAESAVGWTPKRSLRETLPAITAALLADPWAWYRENELPLPSWLRETRPPAAAAPDLDLDPRRLKQLQELAGTHAHHHGGGAGT
ncbi:MAG TPA: NAD(P)-dependent oxidoreductase [bacterium]|jgi:nucleoside-diphosphate-sugar epimerase|nr:NAD(P)-dependent oxidoreductase [bacterium]